MQHCERVSPQLAKPVLSMHVVLKYTVIAGFYLLFYGCATHSVDIRAALTRGDNAATLAEIKEQYHDAPVLRGMHQGVVLHRLGQYAASNLAFAPIPAAYDNLLGVSISETSGSLLINDNTRSYLGSDFEHITVLTYRLLNYLAQGEVEAARVEALSIDVALRERDVTERFAFAPLLSAVVFEALGEEDAALVAVRQALRSYREQAAEGQDIAAPSLVMQMFIDLLARNGLETELAQQQQQSGLRPQTRADEQIWFYAIYSNGIVSRRVQTIVYHFAAEVGKSLAIALPHYYVDPPAIIPPAWLLPLAKISDFDRQQRYALAQARPAIVARALARVVFKHQTAQQAQKEGGWLAALAVETLNLVSEQADTRSLDTLPHELYFTRQLMTMKQLQALTPALQPIPLHSHAYVVVADSLRVPGQP